MKRLKVMTVVGTRPEIIRLSRVMPALDRSTDHVIVHSGQNYDFELNEVFFRDLGLRRPDHFLGCGGGNAAALIGKLIGAVDEILEQERPDAMLVLGDTNSCLAVLPAKRRHIPIFHMEAGNRCFDERVPEEMNRRIVDHVADINLPYSDIARAYLLAEGRPADRIITTGSPMREVLDHNAEQIAASAILADLGLHPRRYFVVSAHREENIEPEHSFTRLCGIIDALGERFDIPVIVSAHPRTRIKIESNGIRFHPLVQLMKPLGFHDYVRLQQDARAVLSDSGTISEESSILDFPAINLREAHERPEAMEEAWVMMSGLNVERVFQMLAILEDGAARKPAMAPIRNYGSENVSEKVVRIIFSYTDYVGRTVWRKSE